MTTLTFKCPGCLDTHVIPGDRWQITGNTPQDVTCAPSLLVTSGHYCAGRAADNGCWCDYAKANPGVQTFGCYRCHSLIRNGTIEFLSDCSHALAGKIIQVPIDASLRF